MPVSHLLWQSNGDRLPHQDYEYHLGGGPRPEWVSYGFCCMILILGMVVAVLVVSRWQRRK